MTFATILWLWMHNKLWEKITMWIHKIEYLNQSFSVLSQWRKVYLHDTPFIKASHKIELHWKNKECKSVLALIRTVQSFSSCYECNQDAINTYIRSFASLKKNIQFWCLLLTKPHFFSNIFSDYGLFTRYSCSYVLRTRSQLLLNFTLLNSIKCIYYVLSMRRVVKHSYHFSMTNECATHHSDEWAHITYVEFHFEIAIQGNSVWYVVWSDDNYKMCVWVQNSHLSWSMQSDRFVRKKR